MKCEYCDTTFLAVSRCLSGIRRIECVRPNPKKRFCGGACRVAAYRKRNHARIAAYMKEYMKTYGPRYRELYR